MAGAHIIDIEQFIKAITSEQDHGCSSSEGAEPRVGRPLICRINRNLRYKHNNAYEPIMLSVGPYNHGIFRVHAMQVTKYKLLVGILNLNHEKTLSDYLEAMGQLVIPVKSCYADEINLDRNNFVKMLLLDGSFVLMSILGTELYTPDQQDPENSIEGPDISGHKINSNAVLNGKLDQDETKLETIQSDIVQEDTHPIDQLCNLDLWHDILLLENQIPFFVISKLYELVVGGSNMTTGILTERIVEFVEDSLHCYPKAIQEHNRPKEFLHLLHLCHLYFRPRIVAAESYKPHQVKPRLFQNLLRLGKNRFTIYETRPIHEGHQATHQTIPSRRATEYQQAGINFKKRKYCSEDPDSFLDILFCDGIIEIPELTIDPNTQNDVSLLTKRGIIVHQINSDAEVCDLFRMVMECAHSSFAGGNYLEPLRSEIEAHYQNRRPMLRELLSSITSKVHSWTQADESSESVVTTSQEVLV